MRPVYRKHKINGMGDGTNPTEELTVETMAFGGPNNSIDLARPSSLHIGGANVAMMDGTIRFLTETIDYRVFQALMTPNGKKSDVPTPEFVLTNLP